MTDYSKQFKISKKHIEFLEKEDRKKGKYNPEFKYKPRYKKMTAKKAALLYKQK